MNAATQRKHYMYIWERDKKSTLTPLKTGSTTHVSGNECYERKKKWNVRRSAKKRRDTRGGARGCVNRNQSRGNVSHLHDVHLLLSAIQSTKKTVDLEGKMAATDKAECYLGYVLGAKKNTETTAVMRNGGLNARVSISAKNAKTTGNPIPSTICNATSLRIFPRLPFPAATAAAPRAAVVRHRAVRPLVVVRFAVYPLGVGGSRVDSV